MLTHKIISNLHLNPFHVQNGTNDVTAYRYVAGTFSSTGGWVHGGLIRPNGQVKLNVDGGLKRSKVTGIDFLPADLLLTVSKVSANFENFLEFDIFQRNNGMIDNGEDPPRPRCDNLRRVGGLHSNGKKYYNDYRMPAGVFGYPCTDFHQYSPDHCRILCKVWIIDSPVFLHLETIFGNINFN